MNEFELDSFDFEIIYEIKRLNSFEQTLKNLYKIWARRCVVPKPSVRPHYIYEHLLTIIYDFKLLSNRQKFVDFCINECFGERIFSIIAMAEAKDLPGYVEWLKSNVEWNLPEEI